MMARFETAEDDASLNVYYLFALGAGVLQLEIPVGKFQMTSSIVRRVADRHEVYYLGNYTNKPSFDLDLNFYFNFKMYTAFYL